MVDRQDVILDLDELVPSRRLIRLKDKETKEQKEFDVTEVPMETAIRLAEYAETAGEQGSGEALRSAMRMVSELLGCDTEWLTKNVGVQKFKALVQFIMETVSGMVEEADEGNE